MNFKLEMEIWGYVGIVVKGTLCSNELEFFPVSVTLGSVFIIVLNHVVVGLIWKGFWERV